jgi:AraC-like DNA-binding protein
LFVKETVVAPADEWSFSVPCWRFLRVSKGQGYWIGKPRARTLEAGDVVIAGPQQEVVVRASQLGEISLHYFHFCPELLTGLLTLSERRQLDSTANGAHAPFRFLPPSHPLARSFEALCISKGRQNTLHQRGQMLELIGALFSDEAAPRARKRARIASARERFYQLINQMPESEIVKYTPEALAQRCGCSLRHFSRLFHEHLGISIRAQQTKIRLEKASQLLRETDAKIIQIARESGYRHLSLFNAMFKRHFSMTPSQYREQNHFSSSGEEGPDLHRVSRVPSSGTSPS